MKNTTTIICAAFILSCALWLTGCKGEVYYNAPGNKDYSDDVVYVQRWWDDIESLEIPSGMSTISVAEAKEICSQLESGQVTTKSYNILGLVHSVVSKYSSVEAATFYMVDDPREPTASFEAFKVTDNGKKFASMDIVNGLRGSWVIVTAPLTNYNGTLETSNGKLVARSYHSVATEGDGSKENPFTVADLLAMKGQIKAGEYYVTGYIRGAINGSSSDIATQEMLEFEPGEDGLFSKITNIILGGDKIEMAIENLAAVDLKSSPVRNKVNLDTQEDVAERLNRKVLLKGTIGTFMGMNGLSSVSEAELLDEE